MELFNREFDLGDFIQASGTMIRTRTGEVTLLVTDFKMLAKAVTPLPAAKDEVVDGEVVRHATLTDPETRFRQRYADLAVNPEVRDIFRPARGRPSGRCANFWTERGFLEVETPILQPLYGGAAAQPFITHHNQLKQDLYLRISFELYLKRLLVGGLDRVYEIGRDFRNEGVSFKHNPEFTQLEFYLAYADYLRVMELTEQMVSTAADKVSGNDARFTFNGQEIDLTPPWRRVELRQGILMTAGIDIDQHRTDEESCCKPCSSQGPEPEAGLSARQADRRHDRRFAGAQLHPADLPVQLPARHLAAGQEHARRPQMVERFEGFVGGMELCNAFTELNDPLDQEERFLEMGRAYGDGR